ncbi:MAG TPA: DUF4159 domain-containing protein [Acidisphaera sp.]|nr:DUF4159 domain-containing protein [Acidisphaera sp.]
MVFASPWILLALLALPLLWWLLRVSPPAPRSQTFPALRLLLGLDAREETPARTPPWLLLLRMFAAALIVIALARPVMDAGNALPGQGPVLLVIDDGWSAASDWPQRMQAASTALDKAARAGRQAALLTTAPDETGAAPAVSPTSPVPELRARLAALRPKPWTPARDDAATALAGWDHPGTAVIYVGDGLTHDQDFARFAAALGRAGTVTEVCCGAAPGRVLLPPRSEADRLILRAAQVPQPAPAAVAVLAQSGDGRTLARTPIVIPAGAASADAPLTMPVEVRNRLARLVLEGPPSVASTVLLDESWRRRPVGLVASDMASADSPLTGSLFYLRRALSPFTELREADITTLLRRDIAVIVLADDPLPAGLERDALDKWVRDGGLLVRFAGPRTAEQPIGETDPLMPVRLLGGDRQLGGALSWSKPAGLAPFPPGSPFAGLAVPEEVAVNRQVLAEPSAQIASQTWAALADGTPLVTQATHGAGRIVLFHVTANADWSNLPLSGLFVDMMRRLVDLSVGVPATNDATVLAPAETLDGYGQLAAPPPAASGLAADAFATAPASPRHPPGLYGQENNRHALNLGAALAPPQAAPMVPGAQVETLGLITPERAFGPWMIAAALFLLALDLLISLLVRGLLRRPVGMASGAAGLLLCAALAAPAHAEPLETGIHPALATRLGYIITGDAQADAVAKAGLEGLSEYVNRRTAAVLVEPDGVIPGHDDLSFYPLLYWPITATQPTLDPVAAQALNDFMGHGGILVLDTLGGGPDGSGAGFAAGADDALKRVARGLVIPPLAPLTTEHVLAHSFYLLQDFPGRFTGDTVWVQRDQDRTNDSVSPVIIGSNDWGAAWAVDSEGRNPYAAIPGGARQRTIAYRFGVNLVMYALTGNYKGDQVHVPAILERLGQ